MRLAYILIIAIAATLLPTTARAQSPTAREIADGVRLPEATAEFLGKFRRAVLASDYLEEDKACIRKAATLNATRACLEAVYQRLNVYERQELAKLWAGKQPSSCMLGGRACMFMNAEHFVAQLDTDAKPGQEQAFETALNAAKDASTTYAKCLDTEEVQAKCEINLIRTTRDLARKWPKVTKDRLESLTEQIQPNKATRPTVGMWSDVTDEWSFPVWTTPTDTPRDYSHPFIAPSPPRSSLSRSP